jgi:hypothetical protein
VQCMERGGGGANGFDASYEPFAIRPSLSCTPPARSTSTGTATPPKYTAPLSSSLGMMSPAEGRGHAPPVPAAHLLIELRLVVVPVLPLRRSLLSPVRLTIVFTPPSPPPRAPTPPPRAWPHAGRGDSRLGRWDGGAALAACDILLRKDELAWGGGGGGGGGWGGGGGSEGF